MTLRAREDDDGRRLDRILRKALPSMPLSALHRLLRRGLVLVDGRPGRGRDRIPAGARITVPESAGAGRPRPSPFIPGPGENPGTRDPAAPWPAAPWPAAPRPAAPWSAGRDLPDILWEGAGLLVVNKAPGLAVHGGGPRGPAPGGEDTLEQGVRRYLAGRLPPSLSFTPGPLHRLDKPTSGIVVFSTTLAGARYFSALLREGKIRKRYLGILEGSLTKAAVWEEELYRAGGEQKTRVAGPPGKRPPGPDRGRRARTRVSPIARAAKDGAFYTLAEIGIDTGRTHQIRAQAAHHGHPLAGDRKYGGGPFPGRRGPGGFFLHAAELEIPGAPGDPPAQGLFFRAPPPEAFSSAVRELFGL